MCARLTFDGDHRRPSSIWENNRQFGFFRLDPRRSPCIPLPTVNNCLFVLCSGFPDFAGGYFAGDRRPSFLRA
ncbi:hypothetical protein ACNKHR_07105 [Shigella flexneri]